MSEFHSPGDLLANVFLPGESPQKLILLTGPRGSGKTTWCQALYQEALRRNVQAQGLISIPRFTQNEKIGIDLLALPMNECRLLAIRRQKKAERLATQYWQFQDEVLQWGNTIISQICNPQLLIIDELGPLELSNGEGWQAALPLIGKRTYACAVVVIRPSLLKLAKARWPWAEIMDIRDGEL